MALSTPSANKWLKRLITTLSVLAVVVGFSISRQPRLAEAQDSCQLPDSPDTTIISFNDARLYSNRGANLAMSGPYSFSLPAGQYRVVVQSYDVHVGRDTATQDQEQWFMELRDSSGQLVIATNPVSDLPDDQDTITLTVNQALSINQNISSLLIKHIAYPSNRANSIEAICASFQLVSDTLPTPTPVLTPSPSPTPSPTPDPTPSPSPTPAPASDNRNDNDDNNDDNDESDDAPSLSISKDDDRDFTRPGHRLTYQIHVKNDGSETITDAKITDTLPAEVTLEQVSSGGEVNGRQVSWSDIGISDGETVSFSLVVKVNDNVSNGHSLVNAVKVRSEDFGLSATDTDLTVVQREGQVAASQDGTSGRIAQAATNTAPAAVTPQDVPITAATGGSPVLPAATSLLGLTGLVFSRRFI